MLILEQNHTVVRLWVERRLTFTKIELDTNLKQEFDVFNPLPKLSQNGKRSSTSMYSTCTQFKSQHIVLSIGHILNWVHWATQQSQASKMLNEYINDPSLLPHTCDRTISRQLTKLSECASIDQG